MNQEETGTFADWLRVQMRRTGHTQVSLAEAIDRKQQTISRYLGGREFPGLTTVDALADALGVSRDEVVDRVAATKRAPQSPQGRPQFDGLPGVDAEVAELQERFDKLEGRFEEIERLLRQWVQGGSSGR